jgi:hypothetical protein
MYTQGHSNLIIGARLEVRQYRSGRGGRVRLSAG